MACCSGIHVENMREFIDHPSFVHSRTHQREPWKRSKFINQLVDIRRGYVFEIDLRVFGISPGNFIATRLGTIKMLNQLLCPLNMCFHSHQRRGHLRFNKKAVLRILTRGE